jgi:hypothetical protein
MLAQHSINKINPTNNIGSIVVLFYTDGERGKQLTRIWSEASQRIIIPLAVCDPTLNTKGDAIIAYKEGKVLEQYQGELLTEHLVEWMLSL